jgi:hypothetical protein
MVDQQDKFDKKLDVQETRFKDHQVCTELNNLRTEIRNDHLQDQLKAKEQ